MEILVNIGIILCVVFIFNFVIFFHELGHFLAAKWRGMECDRFQIWFGKPIVKKTIGGVQYGLGWLPLGGFVSLPQMADMERIEGEVDGEKKKKLPPAKPIDKIIVAFAGPLFSFILAVIAACVVWGVGVPDNKLKTTTIGFIQEGSAAEGKLQLGDKILEVEGIPVDYWYGAPPQDSLKFQIILSEGDTVDFKIEREGKVMEVSTGYTIPTKHMLQRKGHRQVGIDAEGECIVGGIVENSPAEVSKLEIADVITHIDGEKIWSPRHFGVLLGEKSEVELTVTRDGVEKLIPLTLAKPIDWDDYAVGIAWDNRDKFNKFADDLIYPDPVEQATSVTSLMWTTITKIISPNNDIGAQQLNSPLGIGMTYFDMLKVPNGWRLILGFTVLLNINLAILNMLPLPVLDGGHIAMSTYEILTGKPLPKKATEIVQSVFVLLLLGFMFWIFTKDFFDRWWWGKTDENKEPRKEMIFAPPKKKPATEIPLEDEAP